MCSPPLAEMHARTRADIKSHKVRSWFNFPHCSNISVPAVVFCGLHGPFSLQTPFFLPTTPPSNYHGMRYTQLFRHASGIPSTPLHPNSHAFHKVGVIPADDSHEKKSIDRSHRLCRPEFQISKVELITQ